MRLFAHPQYDEAEFRSRDSQERLVFLPWVLEDLVCHGSGLDLVALAEDVLDLGHQALGAGVRVD